MWYFSWILGVGFAGAFSILNAMWLELTEVESNDETPPGPQV
jgi:cyd operon protein YbgT